MFFINLEHSLFLNKVQREYIEKKPLSIRKIKSQKNLKFFRLFFSEKEKKSCIRETQNLLTDAGGGRGRGGCVQFGTPPRLRAPRKGEGRSAPVRGTRDAPPQSTQKKIAWEGDNRQ